MVETLPLYWLQNLLPKLDPHQPRLHWKSQGQWLTMSSEALLQAVEDVALGLQHLGLAAGDRIGVWLPTNKEWLLLDMACLALGIVTVPIYPSQTNEDVEFILNDSECKLILLENEAHFSQWLTLKGKVPKVDRALVLAGLLSTPLVISWDEFIGRAMARRETTAPDFLKVSASRRTPDDLATIIYTSGTTGRPKGALLSHRQIFSEVRDVLDVISLGPNDLSLTFLPLAHVLGRVECWGSMFSGYQIAFSEGPERISANLVEVKPTFFVGVPRVFERIHTEILAASESNPVIRQIFSQALKVGYQVSSYRQYNHPIPWHLLPAFWTAKKTVFDQVQKRLGGRLRFAVSGGAPLSKEVTQFFHALDILVLEGYGLTETTSAITVNTPLSYRFGSVGKPLPGVDVQFADDGEIQIRSDKVIRDYLHPDSEGIASFQRGFFATGDIGYMDGDGFLYITDRKKDLIKTSSGKYIAPQKLEEMLLADPYIHQALIFGDQERYIVALLTLNPEPIKKFAEQQGLSYPDFSGLTKHPQVRGLVRMIIAEVNNRLASHETIKNFDILPHNFTIDAGELTPSLKLKRKFCSEKYRRELKNLYS